MHKNKYINFEIDDPLITLRFLNHGCYTGLDIHIVREKEVTHTDFDRGSVLESDDLKTPADDGIFKIVLVCRNIPRSYEGVSKISGLSR
jgi:hypothetical protein